MSLLPLVFSNWWEDLTHPHSLLDQHFGLALNPDDFVSPARSELLVYKPNRQLHQRASRYHPFLHSLAKRHHDHHQHQHRSSSALSKKDDAFRLTLDVQQFLPEEISVRVVDDHVVVEAKHEEKKDQHGWISRSFTRKYLIPSGCDAERIESHLSSDGVLSIVVPSELQKKLGDNERLIKIQLTGEPAIAASKDKLQDKAKEARAENGGEQQDAESKKSTVKAA